MSIPGINGPSNDGTTATTKIIIPARYEWRLEIPFSREMTVTISDGVAEIFGTELPIGVPLKFSGVKYAIFTPLGPVSLEYTITAATEQYRLTTDDNQVVEYLSNELTVDQLVNLSLYLETKRQERGPRVLIIGPKASGKTTIAKTLVSYAVKMGLTPVLANLCPRDGVFSVPGSLTATVINDRLDVEAAGGWGFSPTLGSLPHNPKQPLVKNFGFFTIDENPELYNYQISKLGVAVMLRLDQNPLVGSGGVVIDTPGSLGTNNLAKNFGVIENIISDYEVDHVVIVGNERLYIDLKTKLKHKQLTVLKLNPSPGCVDVDEQYVRKSQEELIREYFNGNFRAHLQPFKTEIEGAGLVVYKGVEKNDMSSLLAFLPSGDDYNNDEQANGDGLEKYYTKLELQEFSKMENTLVAFTHLQLLSFQPKQVLNTSVKGYIYVSKVEDNRLKVLLPFPAGNLPKMVLLATAVGYTE